jgi:phenylpropionate dioxygenase-like ring-hydroxylating dioxygenase large terminal subunit
MGYIRNCWYVAAWDDEVPAGGVLARTILEQDVLLLRDAKGVASAIRDRCPHRMAPLSRGTIQEGAIVCAYHGLAFDGSGKCVANPHGPIVSSLRVDQWPVHEAHRMLWIWMGDPERADPASIPDMSYLSNTPSTAFSKGYLASFGHYQLYVDNILDLSHTDYLHPTTLGGGSLTRAESRVSEQLDRVIVTWEVENDRASPLLDSLLPVPGQPADVWAEVTWFEPGVMILVNGATPAGQPRDAGVAGRNFHGLTPESATTCHYFFAATRNFRVEDVDFNRMIEEKRFEIFSTEDKPMIEAQQRKIGDKDFWSFKPVLLRTDRAAALVRRRMEKRIAEEAGG